MLTAAREGGRKRRGTGGLRKDAFGGLDVTIGPIAWSSELKTES